MLFEIGDKVFYPMHGAGIVKAIEDKQIHGKTREYCVISIPINQMRIMIPRENLQKLGIRAVVDHQTLTRVLNKYHNNHLNCELPWKQRYNQNLEKLKSGDFENTAEVVRDLLDLQKEKPLNTTEKEMLNDAQKVLVSELSIIEEISEEQAADLLVI